MDRRGLKIASNVFRLFELDRCGSHSIICWYPVLENCSSFSFLISQLPIMAVFNWSGILQQTSFSMLEMIAGPCQINQISALTALCLTHLPHDFLCLNQVLSFMGIFFTSSSNVNSYDNGGILLRCFAMSSHICFQVLPARVFDYFFHGNMWLIWYLFDHRTSFIYTG